jgi:hypothetical protein
MGMFDSVYFQCSMCGERIEEQSKAGECLCRDINSNEVPVVIAMNILENCIQCSVCGEKYVIREVIPTQATVSLCLKKIGERDNKTRTLKIKENGDRTYYFDKIVDGKLIRYAISRDEVVIRVSYSYSLALRFFNDLPGVDISERVDNES